MYLRYIYNSIELKDVFTGLLKSLVSATIIVQRRLYGGFQNAGWRQCRRAFGNLRALVKCTFLVILADVFFTAIFYLVHKS